MSRTKELIALARFYKAREQLAKSGGAKKRLVINKQAQPKQPALPQAGDFVRVQRPGLHQQPVLTRMVAGGRDGITVQDDQGRHVRVRHEHVVEMFPQPTARERAAFASELSAAGVPVPLQERFLKLDPKGQPSRRPSASQLMLLQELAAHGIPVDMERIGADATYNDVQALLELYVSDPAGRIVTIRSAQTDR